LLSFMNLVLFREKPFRGGRNGFYTEGILVIFSTFH
jgi:hypothetical protein